MAEEVKKKERNYFVHKPYRVGADRKKSELTDEERAARAVCAKTVAQPRSLEVIAGRVADDKRLFLEVYFEDGSLEAACKTIGKTRSAVCHWIESDPVFANEYMKKRSILRVVSSDEVETNIRDIASGKASATNPLRKITMPEAVSAMFLLKSYEPDTFRETVKKRGGIVKIQTAKIVRTLEDGAQKEETLEVRQYSDESEGPALLTDGNDNDQEEV